MAFAVIAVNPEIGQYVTILSTHIFSEKPSEEQLEQLDTDLRLEINEPYVLVTTTAAFVESLQRDMPK